MDHYIEIQVLEDPEFSTQVLLDALFAKLHRALAGLGTGDIGISFPVAGKTLGDRLRLHGQQTRLAALQQIPWLKGLRDYTQCSAILTVPADCQYRYVRRVQVKSNMARLRRRSIKKGWLDEQQAAISLPDQKRQETDLPFVRLQSQSTGQSFLLFIEQSILLNQPANGSFSAYGLSASATVPWF